jgi:hypothetical protein
MPGSGQAGGVASKGTCDASSQTRPPTNAMRGQCRVYVYMQGEGVSPHAAPCSAKGSRPMQRKACRMHLATNKQMSSA